MRYVPPFTCGFLLEVCYISYFKQIDGCLQGYVNTVSYLRPHGGCLLGCTLSVIWGRLAVICRCVYSVSYMRQVGGCMQGVYNFLVIWGRLAVVCSGGIVGQVLTPRGWLSAGCALCYFYGAHWRLSAASVYSLSYLRQYGGCLLWCNLSLTLDRLEVVFRGCVIS
jgi:hypothetical protein